MANRLTMAKIQAILSLHAQNWPDRKIARELDVDRETVAKYVRAASCVPKPAKAATRAGGMRRCESRSPGLSCAARRATAAITA